MKPNNFSARQIWKDFFGEIPSGYVIHHIDGKKTNDDIHNLQLLTLSEHGKVHFTREKRGSCEECLKFHNEYYALFANRIDAILKERNEGVKTVERKTLLNIKEVANLLSCSITTVRRLIKRGRFPYLWVGREYRFEPEKIKAWIKQHREEPKHNEKSA